GRGGREEEDRGEEGGEGDEQGGEGAEDEQAAEVEGGRRDGRRGDRARGRQRGRVRARQAARDRREPGEGEDDQQVPRAELRRAGVGRPHPRPADEVGEGRQAAGARGRSRARLPPDLRRPDQQEQDGRRPQAAGEERV